MTISFFLSKHRKKLLLYTIGLLFILTLLYLLILRHPGYIYYWDLSGAFDFRNPFGQYFKIYTPWDGISLGVKNRIPLVSLIYLIYLPFKWLGFSNYVVIKIAIVLLFLGSYTTFYILFPKLLSIFRKGDYPEKYIGIWSMILGLLYTFIPFYTYRISQLHLFYMSIFYPLQIYFFLRILNCRRIEKRTILFFILTMFFGLTSPNLIFFNLVTFIIFFIAFLISKNFKWKSIKHAIYSLIIAFIGTLFVNLYWIIPYFLMGSPTPGYVVSNSMVDMLSQGTSLFNFLVGQAEWFVRQGNLGVLDHLNPHIVIVQVIGIILFYTIAIIGLFKYVIKSYRYVILILLLISAYIVLDIMPYHNEVFSFLVYSPIGWVFREINRISFFWYFWIYIAFAFGIYRIFLSLLKSRDVSKIFKFLYLPITILPILIYVLPINVKILQYLKPIQIDSSIQEVFDLVEKDNDFFSVLYYPRVDYYKIPWKKEKFEIADSEEYKWLTYNSPKPSVYLDSVIPNAKPYQALLTEYLYEERETLKNIGGLLNNAGVKYIVVRKAAQPINLTQDYARAEIIYPMYLYLQDSDEFNLELENEYYAIFKNQSFRSVASNKENTIYSVSSFNILEHLPRSITNDFNIRFCNFSETWESCFREDTREKFFIKYEGESYPYLSLLSKEEKMKYGHYLYDATFEHDINVDWGRASLIDSINGEFRNVLRKYDIHSWDFDVVDKVVYSDKAYVKNSEENIDHVSSISYIDNTSCIGDCVVYAHILTNHLGGDLKIKVNNISKSINTKSDFEMFQWVEIGRLSFNEEENINISLENKNAFAAVGAILTIPVNIDEKLKLEMSKYTIINVPHKGILNEQEFGLFKNNCEFDVSSYEKDNIQITQNEYCMDTDSLFLSNYNYEFNMSQADADTYNIHLVSSMDYSIWLFLIGTLLIIFLGILLVLAL